MREPTLRILAMVASGGTTLREFERFVQLTKSMETGDVIRLYEFVLERLDAIETAAFMAPASDETKEVAFSSVYRDIRYLLKDSSVPPAVAAREIADELVLIGAVPDMKSVRYSQNESFNRWLRKVYDRVGRSTLLRAVSLTVNRRGKKPKSDWPLTSS
jgi:hypothetical protein